MSELTVRLRGLSGKQATESSPPPLRGRAAGVTGAVDLSPPPVGELLA